MMSIKTSKQIDSTNPKRSSVLLNAASSWAPLVTNALVGFLLTPYLIAHLGKSSYGIWTLVSGFLGYYGILRMGIGSGILRYVPFYAGRKELSQMSEVVSTGITLSLVVGAIILGGSLVAAEPLSRFFRGGEDMAGMIRVMGFVGAIECPLRILDSSIRALEKWVAANTAAAATAILRALGFVVCLYLGYGVVPLAYVLLAVTFIYFLTLCVIFRLISRGVRIRFNFFKRHHLKSLLKFGLLLMTVKIIYVLRLSNHKIIIGRLISLEAVAVYTIAAIIMQNIRLVVMSPVNVLWPRFAYFDGERDHRAITHLFFKATRYCAMLSAGALLIVFLAGPSFIKLWVKEGFEAVFPVLMILGAGYLIETSFAISSIYLCGVGRNKILAIAAVIEGVIEITLCFFFILVMNMGITGIALSFLISIFLIRGIGLSYYCCHILKLSLFRYYTGSILFPWLIMGIIILAGIKMNLSLYMNSWLSLCLIMFGASVVYASSLFVLGTKQEEKKKAIEYLRIHVNKIGRFLGTTP